VCGRYKQAQDGDKQKHQAREHQNEEGRFPGKKVERMRHRHGNTSASLIFPGGANPSTESAAFALAALPPYPAQFSGRRPAALRPTLSVWVAFFRVIYAPIIGWNDIFFNCPGFCIIMPPGTKKIPLRPPLQKGDE
jgi:hypothetical protein